MLISQMELLRQQLAYNNRLSDSEIIKSLINEAKTTNRRITTAVNYYNGKHDILNHDFTKSFVYEDIADRFGNPVEICREIQNKNNSNYHNVHNYFAMLINQKTAFILGKDLTVSVEGSAEKAELKEHESKVTAYTSDEEFCDVIIDWSRWSSVKGAEWLHPYRDASGELKFIIIPLEQTIPIFDSAYNKRLVELLYYYNIEKYINGEKHFRIQVQWWTGQEVRTYTEDDTGEFILESVKPHFYAVKSINGEPVKRSGVSWGKVPFISLFNNSQGTSDLDNIKGLIDAYNLLSSASTNNQIDLVELFFLIQGYGGEAAKAIRKKLQLNKSVSIPDANGKIQAEQVTLDTTQRLAYLDMLRRDIFHLGQGLDVDAEKFGTAPSGVALKFQYNPLNQKADEQIKKFKKAMKEVYWFICEDIRLKFNIAIDYKLIKTDVNKSIITNDLETVQILEMSGDKIPQSVYLAKHPFVDDVNQAKTDLEAEETERTKKRKQAFAYHEDEE